MGPTGMKNKNKEAMETGDDDLVQDPMDASDDIANSNLSKEHDMPRVTGVSFWQSETDRETEEWMKWQGSKGTRQDAFTKGDSLVIS